MNAVEHIVEAYYRYCKSCFTITDVKIPLGVGRQFDLLAICLSKNSSEHQYFHVECSVTHVEKWNPHATWLAKLAEFKFCGYPKPEPKEPFTNDLSEAPYQKAIFAAYSKYGIDPAKVKRIWCTWTIQDRENLENYQKQFLAKHGFTFSFLSFRDEVLPKLEEFVGTSNYDDDILRTLSLVKQAESQK